MIRIITDSTSDLGSELLTKLNIEVIPLSVNFSNSSYLDGIEITTEDLYKKVEE